MYGKREMSLLLTRFLNYFPCSEMLKVYVQNISLLQLMMCGELAEVVIKLSSLA